MSTRNATGDTNGSNPLAGPSLDLLTGDNVSHTQTMLIVLQTGRAHQIDLSRTVLSRLFRLSSDHSLQRDGRRWLRWVTVVFWIGQACSLPIPFFNESQSMIWIATWVAVVLSLPALAVVTGSLSVDMVRLLFNESEFRSGLVLNTIQWLFIGITFEFDSRVGLCVMEWLVTQLALASDADFWLFGERLRCRVIAVVSNLVYLTASVSGSMRNSSKTLFTINHQETSANDIVQWTAPTLAIIIAKNVLHRQCCRQPANGFAEASHPAPAPSVLCTTVKARLTLRSFSDSIFSQTGNQAGKLEHPRLSQLIHSRLKPIYIDSTFVFSKAPDIAAEELMGKGECVALYALGTLSFAFMCVGTIVSQVDVAKGSRSPEATWIPVCSLVGTLAFIGCTARLYHRTLLLLLFRSFDVVFCSLQFLAGVVLLSMLYTWDVRCINLISWSIWFHWVLAFDSLTPPIRAYLRLKKLAVTPILLFVFYALGGPFVLLYGYTHTKLSDKMLFGRVRVSTFLFARLLTLAMWIGHLVWDLGVRDDDEFVFLKDPVRYTIPEEISSRNASGNAVHPTQTNTSRVPVSLATSTPPPSSETPPSSTLK